MIIGASVDNTGFHPEFNNLYIVYIGTLVVFLIAFFRNLINGYRSLDTIYDDKKNQIKYIIIGTVIFAFFASITNGIIPIITGNWALSKLGPLFSIVLVGSTSYSIAKYKLFDINKWTVRALFYYLTLTLIAILFIVIGYGATLWIFPLGREISPIQQATYILLATLLALTFPILRKFFERLTDQLFFRNRYDAQALLTKLGDVYSSNYKLAPIASKTLALIYTTIKTERGNILVLDDDGQEYFRNNQNFMKSGKKGLFRSYGEISQVPQLFGKEPAVYDELTESDKKFFMQKNSLSMIFPLVNNKKLNGYLLLGGKRSGDIYNSLDYSTLSIVSNDLAIALDNALAVAKIEDFNVTLQHKVKSATEKLRTANKNLRALDKAKDEFLSMASHQLKTPITTIRGYSDLFITGELGKATSDQTMAARRIMTTVGNMDSTINDLLNVSRISQDRFFIQREAVDLKELIKQELENLIPSIEDKGLRLVTDLEDIPPQALDKAKIRQAVMNLIDNAIYYTQEGTIKLTLKLLSVSELKAIIQSSDIASKPDFSGDLESVLYPVFQVTDTGIGVPPDKQAKLFSKFYRADNAQRTRSDGTGLGIYLVKRVTEDHGGGIFFSSPVSNGQGSTFGWWVK
ncbi:hypothetical protein H6792_00580 [Candidatus Nomurabacteria bacterium]|nr:hypothetical protein [Candidatus Nomurabacteria bacterium]